MKPFPLFLSALLLSAPALGRPLFVSVPASVDLAANREGELIASDLLVRDAELRAPYGLRLESMKQFTATAPIILDAAYIVRNREGTLYRVWVRGIQGTLRKLEVQRAEETTPVRHELANLAGRYGHSVMRVNDAEAKDTHPALRLSADGTYHFGSASGRWTQGVNSISLDGYYQAWGKASVAEDNQTLTFRFSRGKVNFEVELHREPGAPTAGELTRR